MRRTMAGRTLAVAVGLAVAAGVSACTGGQASTPPPSPDATQSPATPTPTAAAEGSQAPSPVATTAAAEDLPELLSSHALDALISPADARRVVGTRFRVKGAGSETPLYPGDRAIKPSRCQNVDSMVDFGALTAPAIGTLSYSIVESKAAWVFQAATPSAQSRSAFEYFDTASADDCRDYAVTAPATLVINNGPARDVAEVRLSGFRDGTHSGMDVRSLQVTSRYRSSADVTYGRSARTTRFWFSLTPIGSNLLATISTGVTGGDHLRLHRLGIDRITLAAEQAAAAGASTAPEAYTPDGGAGATGDAPAVAQDDPSWPIDSIVEEVRSQWMVRRAPSRKDLRDMVLLVCRAMDGVSWDDPNHSTLMRNLQDRIVTKWRLDRITGGPNAWNLSTTAEARCKGATVTTEFD